MPERLLPNEAAGDERPSCTVAYVTAAQAWIPVSPFAALGLARG